MGKYIYNYLTNDVCDSQGLAINPHNRVTINGEEYRVKGTSVRYNTDPDAEIMVFGQQSMISTSPVEEITLTVYDESGNVVKLVVDNHDSWGLDIIRVDT